MPGRVRGDPERVVHQLLEGTLPPELAALDRHMPAAPAANPAADPGSKGKGRAGTAAEGAPSCIWLIMSVCGMM